MSQQPIINYLFCVICFMAPPHCTETEVPLEVPIKMCAAACVETLCERFGGQRCNGWGISMSEAMGERWEGRVVTVWHMRLASQDKTLDKLGTISNTAAAMATTSTGVQSPSLTWRQQNQGVKGHRQPTKPNHTN